jgi:hypothetical protein
LGYPVMMRLMASLSTAPVIVAADAPTLHAHPLLVGCQASRRACSLDTTLLPPTPITCVRCKTKPARWTCVACKSTQRFLCDDCQAMIHCRPVNKSHVAQLLETTTSMVTPPNTLLSVLQNPTLVHTFQVLVSHDRTHTKQGVMFASSMGPILPPLTRASPLHFLTNAVLDLMIEDLTGTPYHLKDPEQEHVLPPDLDPLWKTAPASFQWQSDQTWLDAIGELVTPTGFVAWAKSSGIPTTFDEDMALEMEIAVTALLTDMARGASLAEAMRNITPGTLPFVFPATRTLRYVGTLIFLILLMLSRFRAPTISCL